MKKITALSILIFSLFSQLAFADAYYIRSQSGSPWGQSNYEEDMDAVFGVGSWVAARYETVNINNLFSSTNSFIYMEGSDRNANALEAFITTNKTQMESWVYSGGTLFINAAPNQGDGMDLGFGIELIYPDFSGTSTSVDPSHPIFNGPYGVTGNTFYGNSFGHATVTGSGLNPLIVDNSHGRYVLAEKPYGRGVTFFGGMTSRYYHTPKPEVTYLHQNIRDYQANIIGSALLYKSELSMKPGNTYSATITINNRDNFPINADIKYTSNTLNVVGPANAAIASEASEIINFDITSSLSSEGTHTVEVEINLNQGEVFTAKITVNIVNFKQLTPNTTFNSYVPNLSSDGKLIIFTSSADLSNNGKITSSKDIFIYDREFENFTQLTSNPVGRSCKNVIISGNGEYAAGFCNSSLDLTKPNSDASYELYYFDLTNNTVEQVNSNSSASGNNKDRQIAINHEGDFIYFTSISDLDPLNDNSDGSSEVFLYDRSKNEVRQLSNFNNSSSDIQSLSTDYEGKRFVVVSSGNPLGQNNSGRLRAFGGTISRGITHQITSSNSSGDTGSVDISGNGEFITLQSSEYLVPNLSTYGIDQIFRAEFEGNDFQQITHSSSLGSFAPSISNDGSRIVFISKASLNGRNSGGNSEVFMYENKNNELRAMTEVNQNKNAITPKISADGSTIVFQGDADWITGENLGLDSQIFFQSNLGQLSVTRYEDPEVQYAKKIYKSSSEVDEEATKKMRESAGNISWILFSLLGLIAFRKKKIAIKGDSCH